MKGFIIKMVKKGYFEIVKIGMGILFNLIFLFIIFLVVLYYNEL